MGWAYNMSTRYPTQFRPFSATKTSPARRNPAFKQFLASTSQPRNCPCAHLCATTGGQVRSSFPRTVGTEWDSGYSCCMPTHRAALSPEVLLALALAAMLVVACANGVESRGQPNAAGLADIATNLDVPWGIAFLPDGSALIAERDSGAIKHMSGWSGESSRWRGRRSAAREGGLLGLAAAGQTVFAYLTTGTGQPRGRGCASTGVRSPGKRRYLPVSLRAPSTTAGASRSVRTASSTWRRGKAAILQLAQNRSSLGGKILRINPDGSIPSDNPDPASPVWSFGHRNIQGLAGIRPADCGPRSTARIGWTSST